MQILSTLAVVATLFAAGQASPVSQAEARDTKITVYPHGLPAELKPDTSVSTSLQSRASKSGTYLCNDINFTGYCVHIVQPQQQCVNLSSDLNDQVSSVGPDKGFYCFFYSAFNCNDSEGHFGIAYPGIGDLRSNGWNDKISSYICGPY